MKRQLVVITHGYFGKEMIRSAEMIIGKMENVQSFSLEPEMDPIGFIDSIKESLIDVHENTIYLVDLFGGTPFHAGAYLVKSHGGKLVTGINISLLIEIYTSLQNEDLDLSQIVDGIKDSIKIVE